MISQEKLKILTPLQKLPKNVGDLGKLFVATSFEKFSKVAQSGHTGNQPQWSASFKKANNIVRRFCSFRKMRLFF